MSKYSEKLKDPRWQKKRLEILQRDNWCCQGCFDESSTLNVHHKIYKKNHNIWDYEDDELITLCEKCHDIEHKMRSIYESVLLKFISKKFLANDLISIIETFENIKIKYHSDVTATMLRFAVSSQDVWEKIEDSYFDHLRNKKYLPEKKLKKVPKEKIEKLKKDRRILSGMD